MYGSTNPVAVANQSLSLKTTQATTYYWLPIQFVSEWYTRSVPSCKSTYRELTPISDKICSSPLLADGPKMSKVKFGPFWWLDDTDDYGKWQAVNSNDRWKRLCLVSWSAAPCEREGDRLEIFLLTYQLTHIPEVCRRASVEWWHTSRPVHRVSWQRLSTSPTRHVSLSTFAPNSRLLSLETGHSRHPSQVHHKK